MLRTSLVSILTFAISAGIAASQASVQVDTSNLQGPRKLADQTAKAVIQDYLDSWQSLRGALDGNRVDLLDRDFVGTARDKIAETIQQQVKLGLHSAYQDKAHDIQIVFYSPEGLSIELTDKVEYDQQLADKDKLLTTQHIRARYVVVMTPSETRWRVRVLQAVID